MGEDSNNPNIESEEKPPGDDSRDCFEQYDEHREEWREGGEASHADRHLTTRVGHRDPDSRRSVKHRKDAPKDSSGFQSQHSELLTEEQVLAIHEAMAKKVSEIQGGLSKLREKHPALGSHMQKETIHGRQVGNAKGTKSLLGEETVNQSAHILIASGCCQHTLGQSKCQSNSQAKGKWHHGRRRLHAGFHLFNWCCHGCANLVTWSLTLSEGGWDKALNGWQSKDHQAASNHLGGKSHLASSADKRQLEHRHRLTGLAWAMRAGRGYKDKRHVIWF